ncbi:2-deoxy-D-gluconate 3-dehydrogenase [Thalassobacillus devorans]|uniref:2-deoxy-D-gluconate 3-dehydrogenase n=1 Tax=Thalassobacillus devorans TaxID=279813 RepID=A0ABQ1P5A7_9BACI|nr:glucose 1-dehydrogenase [Thalassobacillus devorans]NIK28039.1 NAD(P)-dependent dehydrogenase (short-subunit alcohol dehydrogenase family) [Thalassobacillus devorans]GGC89389.1 2-deoxy-D-gluconate 3-dehydrogenase [Thalassobacillus devorans]
MNVFSLEGKVAMVTGANRGLGKSIALMLANAGADVVVCGRNEERNQEVVKEIENCGRKALGISVDLNDLEEIEKLVEEAWKEFGTIDILVNNAGRSSTNFALSTSEEEWDQVMDLNVKSLFFCSQAVASKMKENGNGGKIINMASVAGAVGDVGISPYTASKGAVINLTRSLALEWSRFNIQVNAIGPAYIETDMNKEQLAIPKVRNKIIEKTPMKRLGQAEELEGAVLLLAGKGSSFITGQTIFVDGGWLAQ